MAILIIKKVSRGSKSVKKFKSVKKLQRGWEKIKSVEKIPNIGSKELK
jgi:hypothetical protein